MHRILRTSKLLNQFAKPSNFTMPKVVRCIIPPLLPDFHKGQLGRILVVGGCEDYTGAPFFAAMSALKTGADMSHIVCTKEAATSIKSYSPDLMVHPYLKDEEKSSVINAKIHALLKRVDVVLVGPGLGRADNILDQAAQIIELAKENSLPLIIDADGLSLVQQRPDLVREYKANSVYLTPNVMEFHRLLESVGIKLSFEESKQQSALTLTEHFNGAYVLKKGKHDFLSGPEFTRRVLLDGGLRRVSGQGDILSGCMATFVAWTKLYEKKGWDVTDLPADFKDNVPFVAMLGASFLVRKASKAAFEDKGRSLVTTDVIEHIGTAFKNLFES